MASGLVDGAGLVCDAVSLDPGEGVSGVAAVTTVTGSAAYEHLKEISLSNTIYTTRLV